MIFNYGIYPLMYPRIPVDYDIPPTIYTILNSIVNYNKESKSKIKDLAKEGHATIFDFDYPLYSGISKEYFECLILNHYLMRRIGYDTVRAFQIALSVKLNEIMPVYNKMFSMIDGWDIFNDGEEETRKQTDSRTTKGTTSENTSGTTSSKDSSESDRRYSETPQNVLENVKDGKNITDYNYDVSNGNSNASSTGSSNGTSNSNEEGNLSETIKRSPADKMSLYTEFLEKKQNIFTMIFKDLDDLFYGLV